ncbi:nucleoside phosphorylase [Geobacter metallireducens GS-15]|uniref:Nucleoside phosphorylase n=1 Tax=Geobacter metallireducens (strain ATCC 53774 / DSM 7210 / GS-15) TaxID=269799 RepID=Q39W64_GEOMG|nr:phosphorylase [Geobacter metallireducens]ABB31510.2 nucleoside phosphorylase [Geobacter metallireducens GS-15]
MGTIGLIAAMPDEIRPFLRLASPAARLHGGRFPIWRLRVGNDDIVLVESGMGIDRATAATDALVAAASPVAILSFGFGGAALPGLKVGDLAVGMTSWFAGTEGIVLRRGIDRNLAEKLAEELNRICNGVTRGEIITSARILKKGDLAHSLPNGISSPILDMETAAVAEAAHRRGIPIVALRAISDDAEEELSFSLDEFTDDDMAIRPRKVLATIARKPWIIPQLLRLARNSRIAGKRLAQGVLATAEFLSRG